MLTVVVWKNDEPELLKNTINALECMKADFPCRTIVAGADDETVANLQECEIQTEYVAVIPAGVQCCPDTLELACGELQKGKTDAVILRGSNDGLKNGIPEIFDLDLHKRKDVLKAPERLQKAVVRTSALCGILGRDTITVKELLGFWTDMVLLRVICGKSQMACVEPAFFGDKIKEPKISFFRENWENPDWYFGLLREWERTLACYGENAVPLLVQAQILREIQCCLQQNMNNRNQQALSEEQLDLFFDGCQRCLKQVSPDLITPEDFENKAQRLHYSVCSAVMALRCGGNYDLAGSNPYPYVTLLLMEYDKGLFRMDFGIDPYLTGKADCKIRMNGAEIPVCKTGLSTGADFFGRPLSKKDTFAVKIAHDEIPEQAEITVVLTDGKKELVLPIVSVEYVTKIPQHLRQSYWCFEEYMVTFSFGRCDAKKQGKEVPVGIHLERSGKARRIGRELSLMKEIALAPYGSKRMFAMRALYWLSWPFYERKKIWLTFDKLYKGGDCGEYFYKYAVKHKKDGIRPVYIIRKDVPDYRRLRKEGLKPAAFRSLHARLSYLHASMIFATHSAVHSFCGFSKWEIRFVQDRLHAVNTCIQHGLSVQDLTADSTRIRNNNKRYYCASPNEIENLSKPEYDYDPAVLKLTGIPRYDGLVNRDQKQILITPTWRSYIAMPPVMGQARPYNPDFVNTDYFRIYQELLDNEKLSRTAEQTGYKIIYLLHPVTSSQKEDYHSDGNVEIVSATEINYEKILTESSLMVTDYSGVQFDFAYMRKPVVYFHPPKLPPHYQEGGFFYETQGFGEICTRTEELVDVLCEYMQSGCRLKDFYRERQDQFFAFDDHENCRRIFEDALEYQRGI